MNLTRDPLPSPEMPTRTVTPNRYILFRHPGYDDANNVLLRLLALDPAADGVAQGLYAQYALDACGIIAGNRWDGWLSKSKDSPMATAANTIEPSSVLQEPSYYFHLPPLQSDTDSDRTNVPYPIVPTFSEWRFPHHELPESWRQVTLADAKPSYQSFSKSNLTLALQARDESCRMTGCKEGTQITHLCPQKEADWWYLNSMSRYNKNSASTPDDLSNTILLRADLHIAFDNPKFVFVPKPSSLRSPQLVTHLVEASGELEHLYHNRLLQPMRSSIELLFARFAWTILPFLESFLIGRERRRLLLVKDNMDSSNDGFVSWKKCAQFSKTWSLSPKKRKTDAQAPNDSDVSYSAGEEESPPGKRRQLSNHTSDVPTTHHSKSLEPSQDSSHSSDLLNEICQSEKIESSFSTSDTFSSSHLLGHSNRDVGSTADTSANVALAQTWLAKERLRSDPSGQWKKDKAWADKVWKRNITFFGGDARRWLEICGGEFQDELEEETVT